MQREIALSIEPGRFQLLGFYSLIWDERPQPPHHNGCHMLSVTHSMELSSREVASISLNDEYDAAQWKYPAEVEAHATCYQPALVQMVRDLQRVTGTNQAIGGAPPTDKLGILAFGFY
jgi:hypothetical protein